MSRGIGKIQRKIIDAINWYKENKNHYYEKTAGGLPIGELMYCVYYGNDYWDRIESNCEPYEEGLRERTYGKLTNSQKQVIWRAVRSLVKRGLITKQRHEGEGGIKYGSYWDTIRLKV